MHVFLRLSEYMALPISPPDNMLSNSKKLFKRTANNIFQQAQKIFKVGPTKSRVGAGPSWPTLGPTLIQVLKGKSINEEQNSKQYDL
jgi:hypothetical protein